MSETLKGLVEVIKDLEQFGDAMQEKIETVTRANVQEMAAQAKINAPKDLGKLQQGIAVIKIADADYKMVANSDGYSPYAAYVEFGTGAKVSVPEELRDDAIKFKGQEGGSFEDGLERIREWCKRHGIPEDAAYPIFMSILDEGLTPRPFIYPALVKQRKIYLEDLKALAETESKKV